MFSDSIMNRLHCGIFFIQLLFKQSTKSKLLKTVSFSDHGVYSNSEAKARKANAVHLLGRWHTWKLSILGKS